MARLPIHIRLYELKEGEDFRFIGRPAEYRLIILAIGQILVHRKGALIPLEIIRPNNPRWYHEVQLIC